MRKTVKVVGDPACWGKLVVSRVVHLQLSAMLSSRPPSPSPHHGCGRRQPLFAHVVALLGLGDDVAPTSFNKGRGDC